MLIGGVVGFFFGCFLGIFILVLTSDSSFFTSHANHGEVMFVLLSVVVACTGIFAYLGYKFELK